MHRQCSRLFYSPLFIPEDKPLHTLMTKNTYILLLNMPTHLCLYHNINPLHTLMTRVKARRLLQLIIWPKGYQYTHTHILFFFFFSVSNLNLIVRGLPREIIQLPSQRKNPNCSTQPEKPIINNPNSINGNTNKPSQTK